MPSTRKQKAKERRSRQLDIISDVKNVDIMLENYSRNEEGNHQSENEQTLNSEYSRPQRNSNVTDDFWSQLTNSKENSEITIETTRLIIEEFSNQMSRRPNEIETSFYSQIQNAITTAIAEIVLPSTLNTLDMQGRGNFTVGSIGLHVDPRSIDFTIEDRRSSGLQRSPEVGSAENTCENRPKRYFAPENSGQMSRESSVDSYTSEQNRDSG